MLHTTAAYLPDELKDDEIAAFKDMVRAVPLLYPGKGGKLVGRILTDTLVESELDSIATTEDAQLLAWKLHNAVTAEISSASTPFPDSLGLSAEDFQVVTRAEEQLLLGALTSAQKHVIIEAVNARWVLTGGLEVNPWLRRDLKDLPPDRTMLGRAYWTMLHSFSVYLPARPNGMQLAAFKSLFDAIYHIFPCPVCRGHYRSFYHDEILQRELTNVGTKHGAMLFTWKMHDIVTAWGVHRGQWPKSKLFPKESTLNVSQFLMPWAHSDTHQIHIDKACHEQKPNCMTRSGGFEIISDIQGRWLIEGGIDQPLTDKPPPACDPPAKDQKLLKLDMYVMGKCPWCATALENLAGDIECDFKCTYEGEELSARLEFNVHMVGLNNGTYDEPDLQTVHGPSELVGERLELCAREHYSKNYKYVRFLSCMDRNVTTGGDSQTSAL